jgi:hypothetical protein
MTKQAEYKRLRERRERLVRREGFRCWYCGTPIGLGKVRLEQRAVVEHQTPVSRGGSDDDSNLVAACSLCNSMKGTRTLEEYRQRVAESQGLTAAAIHLRRALEHSVTPYDHILGRALRWMEENAAPVVFHGERPPEWRDPAPSPGEIEEEYPAITNQLKRFRHPDYGQVHALRQNGGGVCMDMREHHVETDAPVTCDQCLRRLRVADRNDGVDAQGYCVLGPHIRPRGS